MKKHSGFTLIEMSIVIVIIGFIISGVVVGQSLVQSARLRETIGQYDRYVKAIKEFQDKYQALPGDMPNATTMWGTDARAGGCPNTTTSTVLQTETCNGNGDGRISRVSDTAQDYELYRAWQHLSNAGLIDGKFSGVTGPNSTRESEIGINVPQSPLRLKSGWTLFHYLNTTTSTGWWADNYGHVLRFGASTTDTTNQPALLPSDALAIDLKIDDGKPGTGMVRASRTGWDTNCTTNDTSQTAATYRTSVTTIACGLMFLTGL